jgi:membrane associated rhomboid family serine protease
MTPPITKNLMIINGILFMAMMVGERWNFDLNQLLGLHFVLASNFQPFQLLTYMFMHANITHIFFNMFSLWMFGRIIESVLGGKRFLIFYLLCGIIA